MTEGPKKPPRLVSADVLWAEAERAQAELLVSWSKRLEAARASNDWTTVALVASWMREAAAGVFRMTEETLARAEREGRA